MRRLLLIARKDFGDSVRDYQLHYTGGIFLLIAVLIGYFVGTNTQDGNQIIGLLLVGLAFFTPLATIVLTYNDIVGKRSTGEMTVLVGLPFSRRDIVLGSLLGRYAMLAAITVISVVTAALLGVVFGAAPDATAVIGAGLALLLLVLAFTAISIGISANTANTTRAAGLGFGVFLLFIVRLWDGIPGLINLVLDRVGASPLPSNLVNIYYNLTPQAGVRNLLAPNFAVIQETFSATVAGRPLNPPVGALVLVLWILGPVAVGYYRFRSAEL
jgi:ABC-2 type transport system permease protein